MRPERRRVPARQDLNGEECPPATRREMVPDTVTFNREWNHFRPDERIFRCVSSKIRLYIATNEQ